MQAGYLIIETHADRAGLVRLAVRADPPDPAPSSPAQPRVRHVTRFDDSEAAMMHAHELLKRRLIDADSHLYRTGIELAIAAIESLDLRHRPVYLDVDLSAETKARVAALTMRFRRRRALKNAIFQALGYIAVAILLFNLLVFSFA